MNKFIMITCIAFCSAAAASAQMVPATQNGKTNLENAISNLGPAFKLIGNFLFMALLSLIGGSNLSSASG